MILAFDFDGTICDSLEATVNAANKFLGKLGYSQIPMSDVRSIGVKTLLIKTKFPKILLPILVWLTRKELTSKTNQLQSYSNLESVLNKLSKKHVLKIITSNSKRTVLSFLKRHGLDGWFSEIDDSLDYLGKHRKIISSGADYYIGDETRDVEAAKKAGIKAIAVTWGFESSEVLTVSKPDFLVQKPKELLQFV